MSAPIKEESIMAHDARQTIFWQQTEDGTGEPAIAVRTYSGGLVEIRQGDSAININAETIGELCRTLKAYAAHKPKETK